MAFSKVRTDNMLGTMHGAYLVSFKYQPSSTDTAIENGHVVAIGALISGEREVHTASTPTAATELSKLALVATPEVVKNKTYNAVGDFKNEAGDICRGYLFHSGDIFSVSTSAISGTASVGSVIEAQAGTQMKAVTTLTTSSTKIGEVIALEDDWVVIQVA